MVEIAEFLALDNLDAADRFFDAAKATVESLVANPHVGGSSPITTARLPHLRVFPVRGFPSYLIYYQISNDGIDVIRVVHGARDIKRLLGE